MKVTPRNDYVLVARVLVGLSKVVAQDKETPTNKGVVRAVGPQVEDLKVGDIVGIDYYDAIPVDNESHLSLVKESKIAAKIDKLPEL